MTRGCWSEPPHLPHFRACHADLVHGVSGVIEVIGFVILTVTGFSLWLKEAYLEGCGCWIVAGVVIAGCDTPGKNHVLRSAIHLPQAGQVNAEWEVDLERVVAGKVQAGL